MKYLKPILLFVFYSLAIDANSQFNGYDLLNGKKRVDIPFQYKAGFILIDVKYGNVLPLRFIFDTGATNLVLFERMHAEFLDHEYNDTITVIGSDLLTGREAFICRNIDLTVANLPSIFRDIIVLSNNGSDLENVLGFRVDGILGKDFFKGLTVEIDYRRGEITLHDPRAFKPPKSKAYQRVPIKVRKGKPYLKVGTKIQDNSEQANLNYLLDTGASLGLLIHTNSNRRLQMPENTILGSLGRGLSGNLFGFYGLTREIKINNTLGFENVLTSFQAIDSLMLENREVYRNGIIGNSILSRFTCIFNYQDEILYLKPNKTYKEEFQYDKSGLVLNAIGEDLDTYVVKYVYDGSPADEAGIYIGDIIKKVGCWPTYFYDLNRLTRKFSGKVGKKYRLTLNRRGEKIKKTIVLKDLFDLK